MRAAALLVLARACSAQISVAPPLIGFVRGCEGQVYSVYGAGGAFTLRQDRSLAGALRRPWSGAATVTERLPRSGTTLNFSLADGSEKRVILPGPAGALQQIGAHWLAAWPYAIQLTPRGAQIYRLPAPACGGCP